MRQWTRYRSALCVGGIQAQRAGVAGQVGRPKFFPACGCRKLCRGSLTSPDVISARITKSVTATHKQSQQPRLIVQDRVAKPLIRTHGRIFGTHTLTSTYALWAQTMKSVTATHKRFLQ
jgi:hypothetical protein